METNVQLIPLTEARAIVPGQPDLSTLFRWCRSGCRGVKLRYERIGRRMFTTKAWLDEFFAALKANDEQRYADTTTQVAKAVESRLP